MFLCLFNANIICLSCFCISPTILSKSLFFYLISFDFNTFRTFLYISMKNMDSSHFLYLFYIFMKNHCFYARTIDLLNFLNFYTFFMKKNNKNIDIAHFSVTGR